MISNKNLPFYSPFSLVQLASFVDVPSVCEYLSYRELSFPFNVFVFHINHQIKVLACQVSNMFFTQTGHRSVTMHNPFAVWWVVLIWKNKLLFSDCDVQTHISIVEWLSMVKPIQFLIHKFFSSSCCHSVSENDCLWFLCLKVSGIICNDKWQQKLRTEISEPELSCPTVFLKCDWFWDYILALFQELIVFPSF